MKRRILSFIMTVIFVLGVICPPAYTDIKRQQNLPQASSTSVSAKIVNSTSLILKAEAASTTKKKTSATKKKKEKYPEAKKIWNYLTKDMKLNKYVAAGIMGNIMAEVGGQTLNIKPNLYGHKGTYYGICQWSGRYYPQVQGKNLDYQLSFLKKTIKSEFNSFGYKYKKGFNYTSFTKLKDAKQAALAFAKCYERCSSKYYSIRQTNAIKAYKYFVK